MPSVRHRLSPHLEAGKVLHARMLYRGTRGQWVRCKTTCPSGRSAFATGVCCLHLKFGRKGRLFIGIDGRLEHRCARRAQRGLHGRF